MAECLGKRPVFLMQERSWSPSLSTNLPQWHSVLSTIMAPVRRAIAIRISSGLNRCPTLAIGKASNQAAVWLFCAVSSWQLFQGFGVSSESLQAGSSQVYCVSFCRGDESWSVDQGSVALITSPWGNVRDGSNLLTRPWQANEDDKKHGQDRSVAERWPPKPPCWIGKDACDQASFQSHITYFFRVYSYCGVECLKFLFALEAWGTTQQILSLGIERQFFKMKNAWCGSISPRFSVMLWSTSVFTFNCSGADYLEINLKPAVFGCLTNATASTLIALESCSRAQTDRLKFFSENPRNHPGATVLINIVTMYLPLIS